MVSQKKDLFVKQKVLFFKNIILVSTGPEGSEIKLNVCGDSLF